MANETILNKLMAVSPYIEVLIRHLYWNKINLFKGLMAGSKMSENPRSGRTDSNSFIKILHSLSAFGVTQGSLLIVHSAFRPLLTTGKSPEQIIQCLMDFLGPEGTLAMPAMPKFSNETDFREYINKDISNELFHYDVKTTGVTTGVLPKVLCGFPGAIRSRFPINTMVALGPLAPSMMENNLNGESSLPCGAGSSWNFCYENDAFVVAIGVDLAHSLTMIHVAEDILEEQWPIVDWYRDRHFIITDDDFSREMTLRERHPRWGTLHFAERTLCKDLINEKILQTKSINGITVECLKARELINYLNSRNCSGYPYYGVTRYVKKNRS